MTVAARQLFKGFGLTITYQQQLSKNPRNLNSGNFRDPRVQGFTLYGVGFWGSNRNCIGFVSGVLSCFGGVLFFAFAVMVWVLSGVVGGGWFWGAEGLGLKGWGFGGFPECPWWRWCSSWWSHSVVVVLLW